MKSYLTIICLFFIGIGSIQAQAGMRFHSGLTVASSGESAITPSGTAHYGYHLGVDFRLFAETGMYFSGGVQYHRLNLIAQDSPAFFSSEPTLNIIKGRWGLGFYLFRIGENIKVRGKVMGVLDYVSSYDTQAIAANTPYDKINDSHLGALVGFGIDLSRITVDIAYEKGFINAYQKVPDSKIDYYTLSLGLFF